MEPTHEGAGRPGNVAIVLAVGLVAILAFAAMAIDVGKLRLNQQQLRNVSDAASLAGAARLDGTAAGLDAARDAAIAVAGQNAVDGRVHALAPADVELGHLVDGAFVAGSSPPERVTAVRVRAARGDLDAWLAPVAFGIEHLAADAVSVAVSGGPFEDDCPLPVAVPSCSLPVGPGACGLDIHMSPDTNDSGAWAMLAPERASASAVRNALSHCSIASASNEVNLNNGAVAAALRALADEVEASTTAWDAEAWGVLPPQREGSAIVGYGAHVLQRRLIVFDDPGACVDTKYTGAGLSIAGFAEAVVYDVTTGGDPASRGLSVRITCDTSSDPGGGGWFGVTAQPRLVE
ncbi:MAG: pilus assembly protein TadG-related protein [Myxococcota bacterium]